MKFNKNIWTILFVLFLVITIGLVVLTLYNPNYLNITIMSLGLNQIFCGISNLNLESSKVLNKVNKKVGIFLIVVGVLQIGIGIMRM